MFTFAVFWVLIPVKQKFNFKIVVIMMFMQIVKMIKLLASKVKKLTFVLEDDGRWYAIVPFIYEHFHPRTEMVFGANRLLDHLLREKERTVSVTVHKKPVEDADVTLTRVKWVLLNGAFYQVELKEGAFKELIWICPVTLFVYGHYPKKMYLNID